MLGDREVYILKYFFLRLEINKRGLIGILEKIVIIWFIVLFKFY